MHLTISRARSAQQPRELVLRQRVRNRRHGAQDRRRVRADRDRDRERRAGMRERVIAEVERAAARVEPAHDHLVARDHLLPVDAEVLPRLVRAARDGESPGDERRDVARPAGLHRKAREVDVGAFPHDVLARCRASLLRRHVHHLQEERPRVLPRVLEALRRLRLLEEREQLADLAQRRDRILAHAHRDAFRRAEEIAEHRNPMALRPLEQQRRPAGLQDAVADLGHLEPRVDLDRDALQLAALLELREEVAEVGVFHVAVDHARRIGACRHRTKRRARRPPLGTMAHADTPSRRTTRVSSARARHLRHRPRRLHPFVLPSHRAGGDRRRADARVRDQQRRAGNDRGDVLLRLHAAADSGRRARRHDGSATHPLASDR